MLPHMHSKEIVFNYTEVLVYRSCTRPAKVLGHFKKKLVIS